MKPFDCSEAINIKLKSERSVSFEDLLAAIDGGRILTTNKHPNKLHYRHQKMYVVKIEEYVYLVPYVEDEEKIFLKTIIPSRRATRKYLKGEK